MTADHGIDRGTDPAPGGAAGGPAGPGAVRRGRLSAGVAVLAVVAAGVIALVVVAVRGEPAPSSRAERAHQIAATLRCPICEDLSVADSPAPLAAQMRQQISQQLAAGRTADQIRQSFVNSYGDSVLLSPPHRGIGQVAYLLPVLVLAAGLAAAVWLLRGWRRPEPAGATGRTGRTGRTGGDAELSATDRDLLDSALARLREEEP